MQLSANIGLETLSLTQPQERVDPDHPTARRGKRTFVARRLSNRVVGKKTASAELSAFEWIVLQPQRWTSLEA